MVITFRPFIERDELVRQLLSATATGDSVLRRLRRHRVITPGTSITPRDPEGHLAGTRQVFVSLNLVSAALEGAGRRADAQALASETESLEARLTADNRRLLQELAGANDPATGSGATTAGRPSALEAEWAEAVESLWRAHRPANLREFRGFVREIVDGWAHVVEEGPGGRAFGVPVDADTTLTTGDATIVVQVKLGSAAWSSHLLPAIRVNLVEDDPLGDERRLATLYARTPQRDAVFEALAREAADTEPATLTLLA